jgi:hypothetical protein
LNAAAIDRARQRGGGERTWSMAVISIQDGKSGIEESKSAINHRKSAIIPRKSAIIDETNLGVFFTLNNGPRGVATDKRETVRRNEPHNSRVFSDFKNELSDFHLAHVYRTTHRPNGCLNKLHKYTRIHDAISDGDFINL